MNKLVVMGVAGAGKTALGAAVAQALGCRFLEGDEFHLPASQQKMRDGIALDDADREPWLARLGQLLALSTEDLVISCSALKRRYREQLRAAEPGLRFVYIDIDVATAAQRVGSRTGHLFPKSLVTSQFAALESPAGEPGVLTVSALWPQAEQVAAVQQGLAVAAPPSSHFRSAA